MAHRSEEVALRRARAGKLVVRAAQRRDERGSLLERLLALDPGDRPRSEDRQDREVIVDEQGAALDEHGEVAASTGRPLQRHEDRRVGAGGAREACEGSRHAAKQTRSGPAALLDASEALPHDRTLIPLAVHGEDHALGTRSDDDARTTAGHSARRRREPVPHDRRVRPRRKRQQLLVQLERGGLALDAPHESRRDEREQVAEAGKQRHDAGGSRPGRRPGPATGRRRSGTGDEDARPEEERRQARESEARPRGPGARPRSTEETERAQDVHDDEVADHVQEADPSVAVETDDHPRRRDEERDDDRDMEPGGERRELADEPDRQVGLGDQHDGRRGPDDREVGEEASEDPEQEQAGDGREDGEDVAIERRRMPQVADHDDREEDEEDPFEDGCDECFHGSIARTWREEAPAPTTEARTRASRRS